MGQYNVGIKHKKRIRKKVFSVAFDTNTMGILNPKSKFYYNTAHIIYMYAYLQEDSNVIAVNWEKGAKHTDYRQCAANTRVVGAMIAELMKALQKTSKAMYGRMHLIGHSLGAHIAGYAGERVLGTGRITGM